MEDIKALSANLNPFVNLLIFKPCLLQGIFPSEWKKANAVPIHKKNDKQCVKNYIPVSFLPICSKVLERIIYKTMFTYFIEINLISENQSGFKPGDSCVNLQSNPKLFADNASLFSTVKMTERTAKNLNNDLNK